MAIWAISDLHLSFGVKNKPMNVFGSNWTDYETKIKNNWEKCVSDNDTVLLAGDFSWGMYLEEAYEDFKFLNDLPGRKIMIKGNHDYWWETLSKLKKFLKKNEFENIEFVHNSCAIVDKYAICGTRGWELGAEDLDAAQDEKVDKREKERLIRSLKLAEDKEIIAMTHYNVGVNDKYLEILKKHNVKKCIYGHLHGSKVDREKLNYTREGIEFICTSCDLIDFELKKISD